ncbi:MAG: F0F1 ATP synthase subunit A [Balneolia bacterium]|nr:F0F1 ATP synthase subunit A [Balneolia bacterium]
MVKTLRIALLFCLLLLLAGSHAHAAGDTEEPIEPATEVDILSKMGDRYYIEFENLFKFYLPRIIISDGFHFYGSTKSAMNSGVFQDQYYFENPDEFVPGESSAVSYKLVHAEDGRPVMLDMSISKHVVWFWLAGLLTLLIFGRLANKYKAGIGRDTAPKGAGMNFAEVMIVYLRDEVVKSNIGEEKYLKFAPYLLSCFFIILFMNLFGLMPWGQTPTSDISVTAALAITTFFMVNLNGTKDYWKHVFAMPGVPKLMLIIMIPVEILGLFTKPFALAIRLFANMLAGKMLILSMLGMVFIFMGMYGTGVGLGSGIIWVSFTLFIYALKVFAAFLQAFIFTMFSALFIGMALEDHSHDHHEEEPDALQPATQLQ